MSILKYLSEPANIRKTISLVSLVAKTLAQLFNGGEAEVRVVNGFNTHENVGKIQEGGTAVLTFGSLNEQWDNMNSGSDVLGLGRFSYSRFVGEDGRATWVICGYQPCKSNGTSTFRPQI